nr:MAG TPA: hypothetical protein [Caudoviricetes sp.]
MSSLGIFNKETKTYQKVAGTAEAAILDKEMSDTSENPVQNKVIKKYVDEHAPSVTIDAAMSDQSTNPVQNKVIKKYVDDGNTDKLDKTSVVNNQLTSEEGYALDARQANPNIEGSLGAQVKAINETVDTLKKSVSDGKTKVANAITDKGVETAADATFDVMASNISKIETGGGELHGATIAVSTAESTLFGQTVVLTLGGTSVGTAVFAGNGTCSFVVQNPGTYTVTCGEANASVTVTSDNILYKTVLSVELTSLKIVAFATGTDEEIAKMIEAHYANKINISNYWAVGDTRSVNLAAIAATGIFEPHRAQTVQFVIGDFDHDDLATPINGHTKAAVTLLQKDCLMDANSASGSHFVANSEDGHMNNISSNTGGWGACPRREWCNNVYFAALPSIWQSIIKIVNKKTSNGPSIVTTADKIFLASEIEIFGSTHYSASGEGSQYRYYATTANRYKMPIERNGYVSSSYWERSLHYGSDEDFCNVGGLRAQVGAFAAVHRYGISPCTCI